MQDFEKLGVFYLGREWDPEAARSRDDLLLYESADLTTHGLIVGMTGSGKTGLAIGLLEEAAIDGIPVLAIDPKGDLGNLLLKFPDLSPSDFEPWVDPAEAARQGINPVALARDTAARWEKGLAGYGQDRARIRRLCESACFEIFTPGSTAGRPLALLSDFAPPPPGVLEDPEALQDRIQGAVSGLLALAGITGDPLTSREHILVGQLLASAWGEGRGLDLAGILHGILKPPFERVGIFELEAFFPGAERAKLAMALNSLLASPGAAAWTRGEPLDIPSLLYTPEGRPRVSILSIAHLSDPQRMFFVTRLLGELTSWMRRQSGTSSLRALVYMDEIFGYFPPSANPPSKAPMLTLLKQARAFGVGLVLATQNPVDLDYKGLANCGTWWIGRLQTERDKLRVLDGLEGASTSSGAAFDRAGMDRLLSSLGSRVFLQSNVHERQPVLFQTRWTLSFLRGPLTRDQIQQARSLPGGPGSAAGGPAAAGAAVPGRVSAATPVAPARPVLPADLPEVYLPARPGASGLAFRPAALGTVRAHYVDAKLGLDHWADLSVLAPVADGDAAIEWSGSRELPGGLPGRAGSSPPPGSEIAEVPMVFASGPKVASARKNLATFLYQERPLVLFHCPGLRLASRAGESRTDFAARVADSARQEKERLAAELKQKYRPKFEALQDKLRRAKERVAREQADVSQRTMDTALSFGATMLGALFGRRAVSATSIGRASSTLRSAGRVAKEREDVGRAEEGVSEVEAKIVALEADFSSEVKALEARHDRSGFALEEKRIPARKADTEVVRVALAWVPHARDARGFLEPALDLPVGSG